MRYALPIAVFLLMASLGLSLRPGEVAANWKRLQWPAWVSLVVATFILPPALALLLATLLHLSPAETAGLFMVGAIPGAPLITRNVRRKGFNPQIAASYQIWAALMVPVLIPFIVAATGRLYHRDIWIAPGVLIRQIVLKQLVPLALGMVIAWFAPRKAERWQPAVNILGNLLFFGLLAFVFYRIGPALKLITPLVPLGAFLLAVGAVASIRLLRFPNPQVRETFALCNVNRNAGLALLLTLQFIRTQGSPLPVIACYALLAPLIMLLYARYSQRTEKRHTVSAGISGISASSPRSEMRDSTPLKRRGTG